MDRCVGTKMELVSQDSGLVIFKISEDTNTTCHLVQHKDGYSFTNYVLDWLGKNCTHYSIYNHPNGVFIVFKDAQESLLFKMFYS